MRNVIAKGVLSMGLAGVLVAGCSDKKPTALVVAITSEGSVGTDIDRLQVIVTRDGDPKFQQAYDLPVDTPLPGTIALQNDSSEDASDAVTVTIRARRKSQSGGEEDPNTDGGWKVVRKAKLGFVSEETKLLKMPLRYSCYDFPCTDPSQSCIGGVCKSPDVDPTTLPDFEGNDQVIQTVSPNATNVNTCFFTDHCFAAATDTDITSAFATSCSTNVAGDPSGLNVGMVWASGDGDLVVVEQDPEEGYTVSGNTITLAPGLCAAIQAKPARITKVVTSSLCAAKSPSAPVCSVFSGGGAEGGSGGAGGAAGQGGVSGSSGTGGAGMSGSSGQGGGGAGNAGQGGMSGSSGQGGNGGAGMSGSSGQGGGGAGNAGQGGMSGSSGQGGVAGSGGSGGAAVCNDGIIEGTEACDGANLGGKTCADASSNATAFGVLACNSSCQFDTSGCVVPMLKEVCNGLDDDGNGMVDDGDVTSMCAFQFPNAQEVSGWACSATMGCQVTGCLQFTDADKLAWNGCENGSSSSFLPTAPAAILFGWSDVANPFWVIDQPSSTQQQAVEVEGIDFRQGADLVVDPNGITVVSAAPSGLPQGMQTGSTTWGSTDLAKLPWQSFSGVTTMTLPGTQIRLGSDASDVALFLSGTATSENVMLGVADGFTGPFASVMTMKGPTTSGPGYLPVFGLGAAVLAVDADGTLQAAFQGANSNWSPVTWSPNQPTLAYDQPIAVTAGSDGNFAFFVGQTKQLCPVHSVGSDYSTLTVENCLDTSMSPPVGGATAWGSSSGEYVVAYLGEDSNVYIAGMFVSGAVAWEGPYAITTSTTVPPVLTASFATSMATLYYMSGPTTLERVDVATIPPMSAPASITLPTPPKQLRAGFLQGG